MRGPPHWRFLAFALLFAAGFTGAVGAALPPGEATVLAFDVAAGAFVLLAWPALASDDAAALRRSARGDDAWRGMIPLLAALALAAVMIALAKVIEGRRSPGLADVAAVIVTLALAWVYLGLVFTFHYAHLFFDELRRGPAPLTFPGGAPPVLSDFAYFAFGIGMTFQVADVAVASPALRRTVTMHAILAFAFNIGILALTVNVLSAAL